MIVALNFIALPDTQPTGAFHYIRHLLNIMSEYDTAGTHFIVYKQKQIPSGFFGMPANADVEFIDVPTLGRGLKRILFEQTLFYRYIKPCDVFYSYCTSLPLFVRAKRIFTLHDVYYLTNPERYNWLQRTYLTLVTRLYVRRAHEVLTVSQYSYRQIEHYIPAAKNKIKIAYNILPAREADEIPVEDGMGELSLTADAAVSSLKRIIDNDFEVPDAYKERYREFFFDVKGHCDMLYKSLTNASDD